MDWISGAKVFFWAVIVMESLSVVISSLALALGVPPTKLEIGAGMRVVKVLGGVLVVWFIWNIKNVLLPT